VATPSGNKANEFQDCLRLSTRKESTTEAWRERGVRTQKRVFANLFKNALNPCHSLVCFASGFFEQTVFAKKTEGFLSLIVPKKPHRPAHPSSRGTSSQLKYGNTMAARPGNNPLMKPLFSKDCSPGIVELGKVMPHGRT
jgi:hypothetical protein